MTNFAPNNQRLSVLAKVKLASLDSFIKLLFSAAATIAKDAVDPTLAQESSALGKDAKAVDIELDSDIVPDLVQIVKSNAYDEEELSTKIRELKKTIRQEVVTDTDVGHTHLDMLSSVTSYLSSRSEPALRKMISLAPNTGSQELVDALMFKPNSQKEFLNPLKKIVKAVGKRDGDVLTTEEREKLKAKSPKLLKEYTRLRQQFANVWKDELRNLVNKSGHPLIDFAYAIAYLKSQGVTNPLPTTFEGNIDSNGRLYTSKGKLILNVPTPEFTVKMNPDYDPSTDDSFVFTTYGKDGKISQYVYTKDYKAKAIQQKFQKVDALDKEIDSIRKKWLSYVKKGGDTPQAVASTVLEMLYSFSARIGSMGNAAGGVSTQGISTLLVKNVKVLPNGIVFTYLGKDAVKQVHVLQGSDPEVKFMTSNIKALLKGKLVKDRLFTFKHGDKVYPMTGNLVNKWFHSLGAPQDITVHKLRHVRGSRLFSQLLEANEDNIFNSKKPLTQAQADNMLKELATKVGSMLGHVRGIGTEQKATGSTAIQNYIAPGLMLAYYSRLGLRVPKAIENLK